MLNDNRFGFKVGDLSLIITTIQKYQQIEQAIIFGSRAKGNYKTGSDVDIALKGNIDWQIVSSLNDELNEETNLPYMFDILDYNSIDNIALREHINRVGVVFYERKKALKHGWEIKKLGDVCEVIAGQSPESKFYNNSNQGLPFYQGKKEFKDKFIGEPTTWTTKITKEALVDDILMSVRAPVGPINFATQKICIGRGLAAIRSGRLIDKDFLFNFLLKYEHEIVGNTGAVFNSINKNQIKKINIPIPPLPEQQKIVAILDKAFSAIDQAKQHAEKNLKNAKELFNNYLNGIFINKGEGWEEKTLGEVIEIRNGRSQKEVLSETGQYKIMGSAGNIMGYANNYICEAGTTIIGRKGNISKPIYIEEKFWNVDTAFGLYPRNNLLDNKFIYYLCLTIDFAKMNRGTTIPSLVKSELQTIKIWHPTLSEQEKIVCNLNALLQGKKQLEEIYQQKLIELQELKKSILQKAFNGELI